MTATIIHRKTGVIIGVVCSSLEVTNWSILTLTSKGVDVFPLADYRLVGTTQFTNFRF
jgi:predicted Co/Zn/Cd cation transporter (cation efflux family)